MSIKIGIGKLRIGTGGGQSWDSSGSIPTDLVLLVVSDTEIDGTFTINGTGQDGHKVYISTDNVTFTLLDTLTGVKNYFRATGLTEATKYYFKVIAYKESAESDALTGVSATFNTAMIDGWKFEEERTDYYFNAALGYLPFHISNYSAAQYFNGKTYITYNGLSDEPFITAYDHAAGTWATPVKIGTSDQVNGDDHGQPSMLIDSSGYIHVMWDAHNSSPKYSKSTSAEDISAWTSMTTPVAAPAEATYPQLIQFSTGVIYLFYRSVGTTSSYWGYKTSNDDGANWSAYVAVSQDIAYWYFRKGVGDTIHAVGFGNNQTSATRKNVYYILFNGTNWVNITGDIQPDPIVLAGNNCIAHNSGDYYCPSAIITNDSSNNPIITFPKSTVELDNTELEIKILKYSAGWQIYSTGAISGFLHTYAPALDLISDTVLHLYTIHGDTTPYTGRVEKWISTDAGVTWEIDQFITTFKNTSHQVVLVKDHHVNGRIIFADNSTGVDPDVFTNRGYLWGDGGFVKNAELYGLVSIKSVIEATRSNPLSFTTGKFGNCYNFTGSEAISIADDSNMSFDTGSPDAPFTFTFWLNITNTANAQCIINKGMTSALREYFIDILTNTIRMILLHANTTTVYLLTTAPYTTVNDWVFVCITYDGGGNETGLKIYLDTLESQTSQTHSGTYTGMTNSTSKVNIANYRDASGYIVGKLDELKVWNKVLSPAEMTAEMAGTL